MKFHKCWKPEYSEAQAISPFRSPPWGSTFTLSIKTVFQIHSDIDDEAEGEESLGEEDIIIHAGEDELIEEGPVDCLPEKCYIKFPIFAGDEDSPFWQGWGNLRLKTFRLIENKYFETAVITMILLSSLALVNYPSASFSFN